MASLSRKIKRAQMRRKGLYAGRMGCTSLERSAIRAQRLGIGLGGALVLLAAPSAVVAGAGFDKTVDGNTTTYKQYADKVFNKTDSYNIGVNELHRYVQPGSDSVFVQRVMGQDPSSLLGQLVANGQVWVLNPSGVLIGSDAHINTAGFLASSLVMEEDDFFAGRYTLKSENGKAGYVINRGDIQVNNGGYAILAGSTVINDGFVAADLGQVVLASGNKMTMDFEGDGLVNFAVDEATAAQIVGPDGEALNPGVLNSGAIQADGGRVVLSARTMNTVLDSVVNNTGVVQAKGVIDKGGEIILTGGDSGVVANTGTLDASGAEPGADGGTVTMEGDKVYNNGTITADAGSGGDAGDIRLDSDTLTTAGNDSEITANGAGADSDGGSVVYWSDGDTDYRAGAHTEATGGDISGDGGFVEISAGQNLGFAGTVKVSATDGQAGQILFDPWNIAIVQGGSVNQNSPELDDGSIAPNEPTSTGDLFVYENALEALTGSVTLQANNNITIVSLDDDVLSMQAGAGQTFSLVADATGIATDGAINLGSYNVDMLNGGNFTMDATTGIIMKGSYTTNGGSLAANTSGDITAGTITTSGGKIELNTNSGVLNVGSMTTSGGDVSLLAGTGQSKLGTISAGGGGVGGDVTVTLGSVGSANPHNLNNITTNNAGNVDLNIDGYATINPITTATGSVDILVNNAPVTVGAIKTVGGDVTIAAATGTGDSTVGAVNTTNGGGTNADITIGLGATGGTAHSVQALTTAGTGTVDIDTAGSI
ncbi:MAG: filamentous hemagglutinin N-terminal domain-containing protein, partial [Desulfatibacillaceae bacterium]